MKSEFATDRQILVIFGQTIIAYVVIVEETEGAIYSIKASFRIKRIYTKRSIHACDDDKKD